MKCVCGGAMKETSEVYNAKWGEYEVAISGVKAYVCANCNKLMYDSDEVNLLLNLTVLLSGLSKERRPKEIDFKQYKLNNKL